MNDISRPEPAPPIDQVMPEPPLGLADTHLGQDPSRRERRGLPREHIGWPTTCTNADGLSWKALIVDCSLGGLGLSECPPLHIDEVIAVDVGSVGCFRCRVAWSDGSRCGVQFIPDPAEPSDGEQSALADGLTAAAEKSAALSRAVRSTAPPSTLRGRFERLAAALLAVRSPCPPE